MAKQPTPKSGVTKVRFVMLEAEGTEGDIAQIAAAIQHALKPSTVLVQQRVAATTRPPALLSDEANEVNEQELAEVEEEVEEAPLQSRKAKPKGPRKPPKVEVIDFDFDTETSLSDFSRQHPSVESDVDKYLLIAAWFYEHRQIKAVTSNHIYTGYRVLGWSTAIDDFGGTLRYLKGQGLMSSGGKGEYIINHLGLAKVKRLAAAG